VLRSRKGRNLVVQTCVHLRLVAHNHSIQHASPQQRPPPITRPERRQGVDARDAANVASDTAQLLHKAAQTGDPGDIA